MLDKRRIAMVWGSFAGGGMERVILTYFKELRRKQIQVLGVCFRSTGVLKNEFRSLGIPIFELRLHRWNLLYVVLRLVKLVKASNIKLLHTSGYHADVVGRLAGRLAKIPVITTLHTNSTWKRKPSILTHHFRKCVDSWSAKRFGSHFIALTSSVRDFHIKEMNYPEQKFSIVPNPIDSSRIKFDSLERSIVRDELDVKNDTILILSVGNLLSIKGHRYLISAAAELHRQGKKIQIIIIGEGRCRKELTEQIKCLRLNGVVKLIGYKKEVWRFLSAADIFAMPSQSEGQSIAILEAMAVGLPLVVTSQGAHVDYLRTGENAVVVPPADVTALAKALAKCIENREFRKKLAINAALTYKKLGIESSVQRQLDIYKKVIRDGCA